MKFTTFAAMLLILFLAGCGQSGPLYIPGEPASTEPPSGQVESNEDSEKDNEEPSKQ